MLHFTVVVQIAGEAALVGQLRLIRDATKDAKKPIGVVTGNALY